MSMISKRTASRCAESMEVSSCKGNEDPPGPPDEVQASTSRWTRPGCPMASSWATMPPKDTPTTAHAPHPRASSRPAASSAYPAIV